MGILNVALVEVGQVGVLPRTVKICTTDSLSTVTTAGYLKNSMLNGGFMPSDVLDITFSYVISTGVGSYGMFTLSISDGVITVVSASPDVTLPTTANYFATWSNTEGGLKNGSTTATNPGNINAGLSGTAGAVSSFPSTAASGSLKIAATANSGDTITTITNAAMGQTTTLTIPDPAGAAGRVNVSAAALVSNNLVKASGTAGLTADAGHRIIANTTASYAGGGTSNAYAATGLTSSSKGTAVIRASTNAVSICKALPGTDTLTITFSADPGASTTVDYIYVTAAAA